MLGGETAREQTVTVDAFGKNSGSLGQGPPSLRHGPVYLFELLDVPTNNETYSEDDSEHRGCNNTNIKVEITIATVSFHSTNNQIIHGLGHCHCVHQN